MRRLIEEAQLEARIEIDSAGTGAWHVGEPPDRRARAAGQQRGLDVRGRARKVVLEDFLGRGPVLVQFWATWCKPCLKEMPYIQRMHEEYAEQGLTVLSVAGIFGEAIRYNYLRRSIGDLFVYGDENTK